MRRTYKKTFLGDVLFFIAVVALPSSFFSFIDRTVFFDLRLLYMFVGAGYLFFYFKHLPKITRLQGGWLLLLVCGYTVFKIIHSIFFQEIPWVEVATIFRSNFFYPIATLGFLLYASKMNNKRLLRFVRWLFLVTFIAGVLYLFSSLSGINFYANEAHSTYQLEGTTVIRNFLALPDYNVFLYVFGLLLGLTAYRFKQHWLWLIPLAVTVISLTRSEMVVYFLILLCLVFIGIYSTIKISFYKLIVSGFVLILGLIFVQIVFPAYIGKVVDRFGFNETSQVSIQDYTEEGTFGFRLMLIGDSYIRTNRKGNLLFGNGYIREATKGDYDFVVGTDTYIAPIIWAEGFVGLFTRLMPVFYFLIWGFKNLHSFDSDKVFYSLIIVSLILPEFVNIIQTNIWVAYHHHVFIFYLIMMFMYNRKNKNFRLKLLYTDG